MKKKDRAITDFEKKVYAVVAKIPKGEVRSYKWVAARIGNPGASRAVGNALNKNPFIGKVPCHRVIRSDGSVGGFARGTEEKRKMLKRELVDLIL
jgi:methylated-DNA-[protein]-cysteine S-methyltransferase